MRLSDPSNLSQTWEEKEKVVAFGVLGSFKRQSTDSVVPEKDVIYIKSTSDGKSGKIMGLPEIPEDPLSSPLIKAS